MDITPALDSFDLHPERTKKEDSTKKENKKKTEKQNNLRGE